MTIKKQFLSFFILLCTIQSFYAQSSNDTEGFWMSRGYGWVAKINTETFSIYDISKMACLPSIEYPISMFADGISVRNNVLLLKRGVTQYTFDRISKLPELCENKLSKKERKSPVLNFEILWNTFHEQYAYFKERNVDWDVMYSNYSKRVTEKTSQVELLAICKEMTNELNDGHVGIEASDKILKKAAVIGNWDDRPDADFKGVRRQLVAKYLKNSKAHNLSRVVWGKINKRVGYVQINDMNAQANYGITPNMSSKEATKVYLQKLAKSEDPMKDQIEGMHFAMKRVLTDLEDTEHIIIDLRFNGGGEDMVGLTALSYFIDSSKTVFSKKHRIDNKHSKSYDYVLNPAKKTYKGKLHILQSHWSASAAEIMLLASMSYDAIERIGSPSEGIFSDILPKKLPNGWDFSLSNQIYQDNKDISYEAKGIPVHVDLNYPKDEYKLVDKWKNDLKTRGDTAIEYVLSNIKR